MKRDELATWKQATPKEISERVAVLRQQMFATRHQVRLGQLKNNAAVLKARRDIAVLETLLSQKRAEAGERHGR